MIPAFINPHAGTAAKAREALERAGGFDVRDVEPDALADAVKAARDAGAERVVVAGGDGTVAMAAGVLRESATALAILPGGTLNHFARDHGIPEDLDEAARVAREGRVEPADVAQANDRVLINTSAVGAYVSYVRLRERLERYLGYHLASLVAVIRLYFRIRPVRVRVEVDGEAREYVTPLVFVGVGEREIKAPTFGSRKEDGQRALHVFVLRERRAARWFALALGAMRHGTRVPEIDAFLVDTCRIDVDRRVPRVAVDGEIVTMQTPIEYQIARGVLRLVVP